MIDRSALSLEATAILAPVPHRSLLLPCHQPLRILGVSTWHIRSQLLYLLTFFNDHVAYTVDYESLDGSAMGFDPMYVTSPYPRVLQHTN